MLLQEGHGGWNDKMAEVEWTNFYCENGSLDMFVDMQLKGKRGVIHHIKDSGDLLVVFSGNGFVVNPAAVVKVSTM